MFYNIDDSFSLNNGIIYNDPSNILFDYTENENNEQNIYSELIFENETPSSSKKTDANEQNNIYKSDEDYNMINENEKDQPNEIYFNHIEIEEEIKPNNEYIVSQSNPIPQYYLVSKSSPASQSNSEKMKYTKFSPINSIRKVKHISLDIILNFINEQIKKQLNIRNEGSFNLKQFKTLNHREKSETNIKYNKEFLEKTIGEILSEKISKRLTNYSSDHNKKLVQFLLSVKNISIQTFFQKLFSLTFLDYLDHIRGSKYFDELREMPTLNKILEKFSDDPDYMKSLYYYFKNYDKIIKGKKSRNSKKRKIT